MYIVERLARIFHGFMILATDTGEPAFGIMMFVLFFIYGFLIFFAITKQGIRYKALFFSVVGALVIWVWMGEISLRCWDIAEGLEPGGWANGLCFGVPIFHGMIYSNAFLILSWIVIVLVCSSPSERKNFFRRPEKFL